MFGVIWGRGASRGILLIWDKMVVVKIKECVGIYFHLLASLEVSNPFIPY
jgi:hypothetical protein